MHWSLGGYEFHLANGKEISRLQYLESFTGGWVCMTPPLLMGCIKVVYNIWSHALEFGWIRLSLAKGQEKEACNICSHALE